MVLAILFITILSAGCTNEKTADEWKKEGTNLFEQAKYDDSLAAFDKALELDPQDAYSWNSKGYVHLFIALTNQEKSEENSKEAIEAFDKALKLNPELAEAWHGKGAALHNLGRSDESQICNDKAKELGYVVSITQQKTAENWTHEGDFLLFEQDQMEEALQAYDKAIELDPQFTSAWDGKGLALYGLGRYEEALQAFDKAIELDPQLENSLCNKGLALYGLGKDEEAIEAFDKAIELNPQSALAWKGKSFVLNKLGRYEEALLCSNKAEELGLQ